MTDCLPGSKHGMERNAKWQRAAVGGVGRVANGPRNHLSTPALGWVRPSRPQPRINIALGNSNSVKAVSCQRCRAPLPPPNRASSA